MTACEWTDPKIHNWQHLRDLGPKWEWCEVCQKARQIGTDQLVEYAVAAFAAYWSFERDSDLKAVNR